MCNKETKLNLAILLMAATLCMTGISWSAPMGTAFTYRGFLQYTGGGASRPEDGLFDFGFSLYDDPNTGTQLGSTIVINDYDVIEGNIEIKLDFGPDPNRFDGDARWLEIAVRPGASSDPCDLVTLNPRQEITPTPYALYALESGTAAGGDADWTISGSDMYSAVAGNVGIGSETPSDKLDVEGHINSSETYKLDGDTVLSNLGGFNIFVGQNAGYSTITGQQNSAMGYYALNSNTGGNFNSAMGYRALNLNTTGYNNSAMGAQSLSSNTIGSGNSAMGYSALSDNTIGNYNSAFGNSALRSNTTGSSNIAIGRNALYYNTEGHYNSAVGSRALYSNTTGQYNSAVGGNALYRNTTGNYNSAMGYQALQNATTGSNSAMGYRALTQTTSGQSNSAMGATALYSNTTGTNNSAVGKSALYFNTIGNSNSAMGLNALYSNTTGNYNSATGAFALDDNTTGNNNSAMGYQAGFSNSTGNGNVFIGYKAGYNETGDNRLYIENSNSSSPLIYGEFDNDILAVNGNVGIGITNPESRLHIAGGGNWNLTTTEGNFKIGSAAHRLKIGVATGGGGAGDVYMRAVGGTNGLHLGSGTENVMTVINGNVGIGTTTPSSELEVVAQGGGGGINIYGDAIAGPDPSPMLSLSGIDNSSTDRSAGLGLSLSLGHFSNSAAAGDLVLRTEDKDIHFATQSPSYPAIMTVSNNGNVHIGNAGTVNDATGEGDLYVEDALEVDGPLVAENVFNYYVSSSRDVVVQSDGRLGYAASSKKYKENISPLKDDFSKILAAQPVTFVWKKSKESDVGLIAEEMDELGLQNLVIYNTEGKPESVRYKLLSLYLIEILKDQDDSIKNIQTENESLKERLGSQEKTLKQLQSIIMKGEVR